MHNAFHCNVSGCQLLEKFDYIYFHHVPPLRLMHHVKSFLGLKAYLYALGRTHNAMQ